MIKNEARWLWYSVTSAIDHVDKLLLWDTGSTDGSLEIERELAKKYKNKIELNIVNQTTVEEFPRVRQQMLDRTNADWFLMLDGDEVWWRNSIEKVVNVINSKRNIESIVVPTVNMVGDMFHYQDQSSGRYKFGTKVGHYNLRAIKRSIPGLHSYGIHGVWGWVDDSNKMIQDRDQEKVVFVDAPYLHATFLQRATTRGSDKAVVKRSKKLKYEIGKSVPLDFYYPESFFVERPEFIKSPWSVMDGEFKFRAYLETPLRKIKRKLWVGKAGY